MTWGLPAKKRLTLEKVQELPTLPEVYDRLVAVLNRPSMADIEAVLRQDPAVTGKVLRLANSAFYGLRRPVSTVAQAVLVLGYDVLRQLVLSTSVIRLFRKKEDSPASYRAYWAHCLGTALVARWLALYLGEENPEEFFVAGLLHDIGKLVHSQYWPEDFCQALTLAKSQRLTLAEAEQTLGFSHDQTGGLLMHRWGLAAAIREAVAYHHAPRVPREGRTSLHEQVVHCADVISFALGFGFSGSYRLPPFVPLAWELLGLSSGHLAEVVVASKRDFTYLMPILFEEYGSKKL